MDDPMGGHDRTKRITALKGAAGDFIDTIVEQNEGLPAERQHKVAIVKFAGKKSSSVGNDKYRSGGLLFYDYYNYSQVMKELTPCDTAGAKSLKDTVDSISPAGATRADLGLQLAQSQLSSNGRADAKKVVVFFTDGSPTNSNEFESEVATSAVTSAKAMKDSGATIYTIGIFSGAAPTDDPRRAARAKRTGSCTRCRATTRPPHRLIPNRSARAHRTPITISLRPRPPSSRRSSAASQALSPRGRVIPLTSRTGSARMRPATSHLPTRWATSCRLTAPQRSDQRHVLLGRRHVHRGQHRHLYV